jgi:hypothetical protein
MLLASDSAEVVRNNRCLNWPTIPMGFNDHDIEFLAQILLGSSQTLSCIHK